MDGVRTTNFTTKLPELVELVILLKDALGEYGSLPVPVEVLDNKKMRPIQLLERLKEAFSAEPVLVWQYYSQVAYSANEKAA